MLAATVTSDMPPVPFEPLLVTFTDPRRRSRREGMIERVQSHARGVEVTLLLDDGRPAVACLTALDAAWLELRPGAIVGVRLAF